MQPDDFEFLARLLKERSGLVLTKDKGYLVENRLMPVVRQKRLKTLAELLTALKNGEAAVAEHVVEAMMFKDTGFFRDWKPFEHFRHTVLPNLLATRKAKKTLRILCAGVSTGQEAYSLAMILDQAREAWAGWTAEIIGIDLSAPALTYAATGLYSQFEVQRGLPIRMLLKHFQKEDDSWRLKDAIRGMAELKVWNLMDDLFPLGRFDVVLCRNVLPYFDMQTKFAVLQKLGRSMSDDGVLYVGLHEPLSGVSTSFQAVNARLGIYVSGRAEAAKIATLAAPR
ncbi:MAG: protein-glutamate O-methyltransferase CheR [Rhodospirillaceae bacterium]|nr:protein-glutamate O-methyltransferase CheR [Rhodospirillaceae bacterium]